MPCRRGDYVIAHQLAAVEIFAIDLGIGDQAVDLVGRVGPEFLGDHTEIGFQILHRPAQPIQCFGRIHFLAVAVQFRVRAAEQFLCQLEHERLILLRYAQNGHDDAERIEEGNIGGKIAFGCLF